MKTLQIGGAGYGEMKAHTMAIARGEHHAEGEPTVWFTSVESFAKALSRRNPEVRATFEAATTRSRSRR